MVIGNNQFTKNQQVVYSAHLCSLLSTIFEYIHICLSWKQAIYKKPTSGLLWSSMWFTQHDIWIHTQQLGQLNLYINSQRWKPYKEWKIQQEMVYSGHLNGSLSMTFKYINSQRWKPDKVWKTQQEMVYSGHLRGSLSMTC